MMEILENEKRRRCDACSITYNKNFRIMFGHNPERQQVATFCEGCLSDLNHKMENLFKNSIISEKL